MTFKRVRMLVVMVLACWSAAVATVVYANVSQFTDAYSGCNWGGHSSVYFYDAYGRTTSACADYTYRYTRLPIFTASHRSKTGAITLHKHGMNTTTGTTTAVKCMVSIQSSWAGVGLRCEAPMRTANGKRRFQP